MVRYNDYASFIMLLAKFAANFISRLEIFGALVGRIPHNPLWAELLWQRQQGQEQEQDSD